MKKGTPAQTGESKRWNESRRPSLAFQRRLSPIDLDVIHQTESTKSDGGSHAENWASIEEMEGKKKDAGPLCWLLCRRDPFSPIFLSSLRPFGFWRLFFLLLAIDNKQRIISVSGNGLLVCLFSPPESASLSNYWQNVCWRICVGDNLGERNTNTLRGVYHGCVRVATLVG